MRLPFNFYKKFWSIKKGPSIEMTEEGPGDGGTGVKPAVTNTRAGIVY